MTVMTAITDKTDREKLMDYHNPNYYDVVYLNHIEPNRPIITKAQVLNVRRFGIRSKKKSVHTTKTKQPPV